MGPTRVILCGRYQNNNNELIILGYIVGLSTVTTSVIQPYTVIL